MKRKEREPITRLTFLFVWLNTSLSGVSQLESRPQKEKKSRVKKGQIDTVAPSSTRWRSSGLARMQAPVDNTRIMHNLMTLEKERCTALCSFSQTGGRAARTALTSTTTEKCNSTIYLANRPVCVKSGRSWRKSNVKNVGGHLWPEQNMMYVEWWSFSSSAHTHSVTGQWNVKFITEHKCSVFSFYQI